MNGYRAIFIAAGVLTACAQAHLAPPTVPEDAVLVTHEVGERGVWASSDAFSGPVMAALWMDVGDACVTAFMGYTASGPTYVDGMTWQTAGEISGTWLQVAPYGCLEYAQRRDEGTLEHVDRPITTASGHLLVGFRRPFWFTVRGDFAFELPHAPGHWRRAIIAEREIAGL